MVLSDLMEGERNGMIVLDVKTLAGDKRGLKF
jgi:hypothetical protein